MKLEKPTKMAEKDLSSLLIQVRVSFVYVFFVTQRGRVGVLWEGASGESFALNAMAAVVNNSVDICIFLP